MRLLGRRKRDPQESHKKHLQKAQKRPAKDSKVTYEKNPQDDVCKQRAFE